MKAYTNIEQSKKLAEILPLKTADMCYRIVAYNHNNTHEYQPYCFVRTLESDIPCWSLSAMLDFLKPDICLDHENGVGWKVSEYVVIEKPNSILSDIKCIQGFSEDNPIDACYEMIIKLHEQKLL